MKHFLRKTLVLKAFMLLALIVGATTNAWADEEVYQTALFGSSYNSKGVSSYTDTWTATNNGFTVSLTNFNNNNNNWNYVKCGRKNTESVGTITTAAAIDQAITKVDVTIDAITAAKVNSIQLYTSSDGSTWSLAGSYSKATGAKSVSLASPAENLFYKIEFDCDAGSANGLVTVSKVEFYHNAGGGDITPTCVTPTFTPEEGTYLGAQEVTISTTTDDATIYYTIDGTDPTTSSSVYSAAIPVSATTTIKAIAVAEGYDDSAVASATYTIVTIEHAGSEADPYTVADARIAIDAETGVTGVYATGIVSQIVTPYNSTYGNISYNISADGLTTSDQLQAFRGKSYDGEWFTSADDIQVGDVVVIYGNLKKYNETYEFDADNQLVSLSRAPEKEEPGLSYSAASVTLTVGDAFDAPLLSNPNGLTVSYESSNTAVATVTNEGVVSLVEDATGTTTITASFAGNETYKAGSASYTITVNAPAGDKTYFALVAEFEGSHYAINSTAGATWGATEVGAVNGKVINAESDALSWEIATYGTGVTIQNKATNVFIGYKSSGTDLQASNTSVKWEIDNENKTWTNQNGKTSGTVRTLAYNGTGFKNYAVSNINGAGYSGYTTAYTFADGYVRDLTSMSSSWGTICLPSTVEAEDIAGATFYSIAGKTVDGSGNPTSLALTPEEDGLLAGIPYIFEATEDAKKIVAAYQDDSEDASNYNGLYGSLTGQDVAEGMYLLSGGNVIKCGTGCTIGANRAYINMDEVPVTNNVKGMTLLYIGGATPTGIETIENGQMGNVIYNLAGQRVNKAQKGIYIQNGKKYIVK